MSVRQGNKTIAGHTGCHFDLFDHKWADHILDDPSWLRADTFSWQSGAVYQAAYAHLVLDIDEKTLQSETISGTTVQFYLADDGHKICPASEESNVAAIYTATGVAWYYIIDTTNQRFKLPRTQFGVTGLRDIVGKYVEAGLPNITGGTSYITYIQSATVDSGALYFDDDQKNTSAGNSTGPGRHLKFDASRSSPIYGNSITVQPKATQMYLYFYVGNFTQTALENTAGLNTELFNGKADTDLSNTPIATADYVVESQLPTADNNYTWYRKYKSGWVEQGGTVTMAGSAVQPTLLIIMIDTEYKVNLCCRSNSNGWPLAWCRKASCTTTKIYIDATGRVPDDPRNITIDWEVKGMAA